MARDGLDVVLIERGNRPGEKNVMSGVLVTDKLAELVPDFAEHAPLQRRIVSGYTRYFLTDNGVLSWPSLRDYRPGMSLRPYFTVFRSEFDAWFAQQAVDAGAELFTATLVEDLLQENGQVVGVRTRRGDLRARVVIGADGVNSTVAEKSGLRSQPGPSEVSLIIRQILNLPAGVIEDRFVLQPGEGVLSVYEGLVSKPNGGSGIYYTELYTNNDSLSLTVETPLDVLTKAGVPNHEVLAAREHHPHISRLIRGATLREYQAHLIPWGGVSDLGCLYGNGVLLAGDAGKFTTAEGVGSWPAMSSGAAAAKTVKHACQKSDFSRATLAAYRDILDEEGMIDVQREAKESWDHRRDWRSLVDQRPDLVVHIARRYYESWRGEPDDNPYSIWGEAYHKLVKPMVPWYIRWPLGIATWVDTLRWRKQQAKLRR
jgi:electron transfer flavoprotein-quinone oxidoreductase